MQEISKKLTLWQIRLTATVLAIELGLLILFWRQIPPEIPIFYSHTWGTEQLAAPTWLWLLPLITLLLGIISSFVVNKLKLDTVLICGWLLSSIAIQIIITLALIRIVVLVV